jgi:hypothetical protein
MTLAAETELKRLNGVTPPRSEAVEAWDFALVYEANNEEDNMWTLENLYHIMYFENWIQNLEGFNRTCEYDITGVNQCSGNSFVSLINEAKDYVDLDDLKEEDMPILL